MSPLVIGLIAAVGILFLIAVIFAVLYFVNRKSKDEAADNRPEGTSMSTANETTSSEYGRIEVSSHYGGISKKGEDETYMEVDDL